MLGVGAWGAVGGPSGSVWGAFGKFSGWAGFGGSDTLRWTGPENQIATDFNTFDWGNAREAIFWNFGKNVEAKEYPNTAQGNLNCEASFKVNFSISEMFSPLGGNV